MGKLEPYNSSAVTTSMAGNPEGKSLNGFLLDRYRYAPSSNEINVDSVAIRE